jgi:hypothetical protein
MKTFYLRIVASTVFLCQFSLHAADKPRFDGVWDVTLTCPKSPDGAKGFSFDFDAQVRNGVLHGERGTKGEPGWLQLDGPVKDDGSAALVAEGVTNIPGYAVNHVPRGTAYKHAVSAQFDGKQGKGSWITVRTCDFTFEKKAD